MALFLQHAYSGGGVSKIVWKKHDLSMEFDGKKVHAEIIWWAKDYYILVKKPVDIRLKGSHMLYVAPAKFVIEEDVTDPSPIKQVPILGTCKSMVISALS